MILERTFAKGVIGLKSRHNALLTLEEVKS
jgi:hypothetical protein